MTLTGNLGNVMKESATIALEYVKAHAARFGLDTFDFENTNIHLHVPEGAIPKDGPSAGITMATSIVSALTHRKVRKRRKSVACRRYKRENLGGKTCWYSRNYTLLAKRERHK